MGFFDGVKKAWTNYVAPLSLPIAGGAMGGPAGAMAGGNAAALLQGKGATGPTDAQIWEMNQNQQMQREFAQHGIRWKVEDAKAAGIHPLVGLGASTTSFSPVSVGGSGPGPDHLADMGQNISRAMSATRTQEERELSALQIQSAQLDLNGKALDNQIKQAQLSRMNGVGPAMPSSSDQSFIPGQGAAGGNLIMTKPMERTASQPGHSYSEPGAITDTGWLRTPTGLVPVPSKDAKERIEDVMPHEWGHFIRNNVAPNFGRGPRPPKSALPKGATDWVWSVEHQEYRAVRRKTVPYGGREPDKSPFTAPTSSRGYKIERR